MKSVTLVCCATLWVSLASAACDPPPESVDSEFRVVDAAEIVAAPDACAGSPVTLTLEGPDPDDGEVTWAIVEHPPEPGSEACLIGAGPDAVISAAVAGIYVVQASLDGRVSAQAELLIDACADEPPACSLEAIPPSIRPGEIPPSIVPGEIPPSIRPGTIPPSILPDGSSVSAGCWCLEG